jgi:hypothetical protein
MFGEMRGAYRVSWGNLRERDHLKDPNVDGRMILKWVFVLGWRHRLDRYGS